MVQRVLYFLRNEAGMGPIEYVLMVAILLVGTTVVGSAAGFSLADLV